MTQRYRTERTDKGRWRVIDTEGTSEVTRLIAEYNTRKAAQNLTFALNSGAAKRLLGDREVDR
jgi:hypothetical protein